MPSTRIMPNRLIMLMLCPVNDMTPMAPSKAAGMPTATQNATRAFKNTNRTANTMARPPRPLDIKSQIRPSISLADSLKTVSETPGGKSARIAATV